jgi:hypothetical protein
VLGHDRVGGTGTGKHRGGEIHHVVRAQDGSRGGGEGQVDQGFVPGGLLDFLGGAAGPDGLADKPDPPPAMGLGEVADGWDDPAGVTAQAGHVGEGDLPVQPVQAGTQQAHMSGGHGDQDRLPGGQAVPDEPGHPGLVGAGES